MAALRPVHRLNGAVRRALRRERVFRDTTHPFDLYDDVELFDRYRFRQHNIMHLVDLIGDDIAVVSRKGSLTATLQILIALRFFACGCFQVVVGDLTQLSDKTLQ